VQHLSRQEIRRRIAAMPPSRAMVRELMRLIRVLQRENASLKRRLGYR
jgi:hypothetical protein